MGTKFHKCDCENCNCKTDCDLQYLEENGCTCFNDQTDKEDTILKELHGDLENEHYFFSL